MDHRNSKEINLAKPIQELSEVKTEHFSCNMIFERPFLTNSPNVYALV